MKKLIILSLFLLPTGCTVESSTPTLNYQAPKSAVVQEEVKQEEANGIKETISEVTDKTVETFVKEVIPPEVSTTTETKEGPSIPVVQEIVEAPVASTPAPVVETPAVPVVSAPTPVVEPVLTPETNSTLSNDNYYTNVDGNVVHSPAYSSTIPPGATAICRDGNYSFSQNRRGTCSGHGGVAEWL